MQQYRRTGTVRATKIIAIAQGISAITLSYEDGHGETIYKDDPLLFSHEPARGDYLVEQDGGTRRFWPAHEFQAAHALADA